MPYEDRAYGVSARPCGTRHPRPGGGGLWIRPERTGCTLSSSGTTNRPPARFARCCSRLFTSPLLLHDLDRAAHPLVDPAEERVDTGLVRRELPVGAVAERFIGRLVVGAELAALQIHGKITTYDISVTHPYIKTRFQTLMAEAGFAAKDNQLFTLGSLTGDDRIRMVKLGINYDRLDLSGRTYFSLYGFQGLGELLGGMDNDAQQTTRQGADNRFTKANVYAGRIHSLGHDVLLVVRASGQVTTGPVVVIEQMLLGGADSVRGYQLGERFVDEGYTISVETRVPFFPSVFGSMQAAAFIDHGAGRLRNPQPGEQSFSSLTGTGVGLQTELPYFSTRLRFDVGFPLGPTPSGGTIAGDRSPIFYVQAMARF